MEAAEPRRSASRPSTSSGPSNPTLFSSSLANMKKRPCSAPRKLRSDFSALVTAFKGQNPPPPVIAAGPWSPPPRRRGKSSYEGWPGEIEKVMREVCAAEKVLLFREDLAEDSACSGRGKPRQSGTRTTRATKAMRGNTLRPGRLSSRFLLRLAITGGYSQRVRCPGSFYAGPAGFGAAVAAARAGSATAWSSVTIFPEAWERPRSSTISLGASGHLLIIGGHIWRIAPPPHNPARALYSAADDARSFR